MKIMGQMTRVARAAGGAALALAGLVMVILPGPGIPLVLAGLVLLEREFHWARRLRVKLTALGSLALRVASCSVRWLWARAAYALALLPVLTDWVDTGHWPGNPRELATEISIGALIILGVALLYRRGDRFKRLAETDALTGLGNRLRFRGDIEAAVTCAREAGQPLAVAFVDVDRLKEINDRWGHAAGDAALREVACALERAVRQGIDGCYRFGGDEFAILVSGSDGTGLLAALDRSFARVPARGMPISCSIGVVTLRQGESPGDLVRRADELMYAAKRGQFAIADRSHTLHGRVSSRTACSVPGARAAGGGEQRRGLLPLGATSRG